AVHRLRYLAKGIVMQPMLPTSGVRRVIYLCFNRALADVVRQMIHTLYGGQVPGNVEVSTLDKWADSYLAQRGVLSSKGSGAEAIYRREKTPLDYLLANRMKDVDYGRLTPHFVAEEIRYVIIGRGIRHLEEYLNVARAGRKTGLRESERRLVWRLYEEREAFLRQRSSTSVEKYAAMALAVLADDATFVPYDAVIVDEAQDFTPIALRLAMRLAGNQLARISVFGDAAQSIYPTGFSWSLPELSPQSRELHRLTRNHRNTAQIYELANALLGGGVGPSEPDAYVTADRPISTGLVPVLVTCPDSQMQLREVAMRIRGQLDDGVSQQTIGVLCGKRSQMKEMASALREAGISVETQGQIHLTQPSVKVLTMHSAKGLDFPHVYLIGLTDDGIPGMSLDVGDPYYDELEK
ncbi:MAG: 3'-5' exonuclease, partial [Ktedonobacterales bacterium]